MTLFVDRKFVPLIGIKLERFTQKKDCLWNFRCPICNDSKKNKLKARGYFYQKKSNLFFVCHNCQSSMSFGNFIKTLDKSLYKEYQLEKYREQSHGNIKQPEFVQTKPIFNKKTLINLPTIESLSDDHIAKKYCIKRKLPCLNELYFAEDFALFIRDTFGSSDNKLPENDQRIVIPFYDEKNILLGIQGRAILNSKVRYITQKISEDSLKVFGLNKVDFTKPVYVVEGPIDSMFLDNSLAVMDAALYNIVNLLGKKHDYVFVYDNEKRNKNILQCMIKTIDMNQRICIWPKNIKEKDINDMILVGHDVKKIVDNNTFQGARAKLELEMWRKC